MGFVSGSPMASSGSSHSLFFTLYLCVHGYGLPHVSGVRDQGTAWLQAAPGLIIFFKLSDLREKRKLIFNTHI